MSFEEDKESYKNLGCNHQNGPSRVTFPTIQGDLNHNKMKKLQKPKILKKKSRISLALEQNSEKDGLGDEDTKSSSFGSQEEKLESASLVSINISAVVGAGFKTIQMIINSSVKIKFIIQKCLNEFNKLFANEKALFKLIDDPDCYVLKPSKKSGKPKTDMPPFCEDISLADTHTTNFSICWKEDPDNFIIMFERAKSKKLCNNKCVIF